MTLSEFELQLREQMSSEYLRPFVCNGSPLESQVFVVGFNPATKFAESFWSHWNGETGFLRTEFLKDFRVKRNQNNKLRGARARLEEIADHFTHEFGRNAILETNIYSDPTPSARELRQRDTKVFKFLLNEIGPKIVYLHGKEAIQFFCPQLEFTGFEELRDITKSAFPKNPPFQVLATSHLRNMRLNKAAAVGAALGSLLAARIQNETDADAR